MVSLKNTLLMALAAFVQASPLATPAEDASAGRVQPPQLPDGTVDISDDRALVEELFPKYGLKTYFEESTSPNTASQGGIQPLSGACSQGDCPDHFKGFDMLFSRTAIPGFGSSQSYDIRVDECGQCHRKSVGVAWGGCYDVTACGRAQSICVDSSNSRAHRYWKDTKVKKCYRMQYQGLGGCGVIQFRALWSPTQEVPCNW